MPQTSSQEPFETILYEKRGAITHAAVNRPKVMNALSRRVIAELRSAFEDARDDILARAAACTPWEESR